MYNFKKLYTLDFSEIKYYDDIHEIIKRELDFPDYYGCNWDAFWDCLTDMAGRPVNIRIIGIEMVEKKFGSYESNMLIDTLKEFKNYRNGKFTHEIHIEVIRDNESKML